MNVQQGKYNEIRARLADARQKGYAVGSYSPRNTMLIPWILSAAQDMGSPVIVQISSNELRWFSLSAKAFADAFFAAAEQFSVPAILHLDHTYEIRHIEAAVEAGFHSVMIDGSKLPFAENIALTRETVSYAHARGIFVEAELGNIGGTDTLENGADTSLYTVPEQAAEFVQRTGCDSLAISIGTAHGVYPVKNPTIDFDRLLAIRDVVACPLVLHGGSGLPKETVNRAIKLDGTGGVSKLNIATDLELLFQNALHVGRMDSALWPTLPPEGLRTAGLAVRAFVMDRMRAYLFSEGRI